MDDCRGRKTQEFCPARFSVNEEKAYRTPCSMQKRALRRSEPRDILKKAWPIVHMFGATGATHPSTMYCVTKAVTAVTRRKKGDHWAHFFEAGREGAMSAGPDDGAGATTVRLTTKSGFLNSADSRIAIDLNTASATSAGRLGDNAPCFLCTNIKANNGYLLCARLS